jgi:hypothetical protein
MAVKGKCSQIGIKLNVIEEKLGLLVLLRDPIEGS